MIRIGKLLTRTLSFRLSLKVIVALATLLLLALLVMFYFSRKAVKEEALLDAEQTLEAMVQRIDNILLSVEQASGNVYWKMSTNLHNKEMLETYTRKLVEVNPYISDCRIVWDDNKGKSRDSVSSNAHVPATISDTGWISPQDANMPADKPVGIFTLPFYENRQKVGNLVVEVSLTQLSKIILDSKSSPNSFCTLLGKDGTILVHPDKSVLNKNIIILSNDDDVSMREAIQEMIAGKTGYREVVFDDVDYDVFYKPFERNAVQGRAMSKLGWSAGIILPEDDIFGEYNRLLYIVIVIAIVAILLQLLSCYLFIKKQLSPLRELEASAQQIADGHYDETIAISSRQDEVGLLQTHFRDMQQSLAQHVYEMQGLTRTLKERGETLKATYEQTKAANSMKMNFLSNMSDQIMEPVNEIHNRALTISNHLNELSEEETSRFVDEIQTQGGKVTSILNNVIAKSEKITN